MQKHLLFSALTAPPVEALVNFLGLDQNRAIIYVLGAIAASAVTLAWWVLARHVTTTPYALLFAVIYGVAFVNLIQFSVPETYSLTGLAIIGYFWFLLSRGPRNLPGDACLHGLAAGLAGLLNPPLLSLLAISILYCSERGAFRRNAAFACTALVVALAAFGLPYMLIHGAEILDFMLGYGQHWASVDNLAKINLIAFVCISFFLVSFVSPLDMSVVTYSLADFVNYLSKPPLLITVTLYAALTFMAIKRALADKDRLFIPVLCWFLVMLTFYIYFNPREAALYAGQMVFPLILLLARGIDAGRMPRLLGPLMVGALAFLLALQNVPVLYRTASFLAANPEVCKM